MCECGFESGSVSVGVGLSLSEDCLRTSIREDQVRT
jgi:hypothetical protein